MKIISIHYPENSKLEGWDKMVFESRMKSAFGDHFDVSALDACRGTLLGYEDDGDLGSQLRAFYYKSFKDMDSALVQALIEKAGQYLRAEIHLVPELGHKESLKGMGNCEAHGPIKEDARPMGPTPVSATRKFDSLSDISFDGIDEVCDVLGAFNLDEVQGPVDKAVKNSGMIIHLEFDASSDNSFHYVGSNEGHGLGEADDLFENAVVTPDPKRGTPYLVMLTLGILIGAVAVWAIPTGRAAKSVALTTPLAQFNTVNPLASLQSAALPIQAPPESVFTTTVRTHNPAAAVRSLANAVGNVEGEFDVSLTVTPAPSPSHQ